MMMTGLHMQSISYNYPAATTSSSRPATPSSVMVLIKNIDRGIARRGDEVVQAVLVVRTQVVADEVIWRPVMIIIGMRMMPLFIFMS